MVKDDIKFECPSCKEAATATEWDQKTISICRNRSEKRQFKSIGLESSRSRVTLRMYLCPHCEKFISGSLVTGNNL